MMPVRCTNGPKYYHDIDSILSGVIQNFQVHYLIGQQYLYKRDDYSTAATLRESQQTDGSSPLILWIQLNDSDEIKKRKREQATARKLPNEAHNNASRDELELEPR